MGSQELDEARQSDRVSNRTIYSSSRDSGDSIRAFIGATGPRDVDPESERRWLATVDEASTGPSIMSMSMSGDDGFVHRATQTEGTPSHSEATTLNENAIASNGASAMQEYRSHTMTSTEG